MEDQSEDGIGAEGREGECSVKTEDVEDDCQKRQTDVSNPDPDAEVEDHETLPHSEILDIFEEGLAQLVQDPLLCDLPIQVLLFICSLCFMLLMTRHIRPILLSLVFFFLFISNRTFILLIINKKIFIFILLIITNQT